MRKPDVERTCTLCGKGASDGVTVIPVARVVCASPSSDRADSHRTKILLACTWCQDNARRFPCACGEERWIVSVNN